MGRRPATPEQRARLVAEIAEVGLDWSGAEAWHDLAVDALDYARRPALFERRVPSFGAMVAPTTDPATWEEATGLTIDRRPLEGSLPGVVHLYVDGLSSWVVLDPAGRKSGVVFDRPAGAERDLVVLADVTGATMIQRHPNGLVRVVGRAGVHRWDGMSWQHQPPVSSWIDAIVDATCVKSEEQRTLERLVAFALHDLAARNIGATLVVGAGPGGADGYERRLPIPPPLRIAHPPDLAPLRHALAQIDGATVFAADGTLAEIGIRLVPTADAETSVAALRGMRHTSARRYSADDPAATVIVVSEIGTVTVLRAGEIVGVSPGPYAGDNAIVG